jgi:hypothetical protein
MGRCLCAVTGTCGRSASNRSPVRGPGREHVPPGAAWNGGSADPGGAGGGRHPPADRETGRAGRPTAALVLRRFGSAPGGASLGPDCVWHRGA